MFVEQKNNAIFRISLTLDRVLSPFWSLSRHLLKDALLSGRDYTQFDEEFESSKLERLTICDEKFEKTRQEILTSQLSGEEKAQAIAAEEKSKYDVVFNEAFLHIVTSYMQKIVSPESFNRCIKDSCSVIVYDDRGDCRFYAEGDAKDRFDKEYRAGLYSLRIVDQFLRFLNNGEADDNSFNPKIYANIFPNELEDDAVSIASPLYVTYVLTPKDGLLKQNSELKVWFNKKCLKSLGYAEPHGDTVCEYCHSGNVIGLEVGQYFIPLVTEWKQYFEISNKAEIAWTDHKNRIYRFKGKENDDKPQKKAKTKMTDDEKSFVEAAKSDDFTNILSFLSDNLYLGNDAVEVKDEYQHFFHTLVKVEELKHLPDYKLYVPNPNQETILGVYKIHKLAGESEYPLRHMLYTRDNNLNGGVKDYNDEQRNVTSVKVLKPQYASFYMMDYYEFFVESVLKKLKEDGVIKDFMRNLQYVYRNENNVSCRCEIDALVYNGSKIFVLELKTTLHIEYLKTYPKRYSVFLKDSAEGDTYEFCLISSFAEDTISVLNNAANEGYNVKREGLNTIPYKFDACIPGTDRLLHCLAESSFEKLQSVLGQIFA